MNLLQSIHELPKMEKIKVMEFLWEDLTLEEKKYKSPNWHKDALAETEKRMAVGKEKIIDWSDAKQFLRNEFK
ncbi:MAG: acyl-protein synthetase [Desulfobacteraceae bacterium 4572_19]|nr:MAG: acyl-protein synthetase [Desulfobacteraceae bacterium 4572_19]